MKQIQETLSKLDFINQEAFFSLAKTDAPVLYKAISRYERENLLPSIFTLRNVEKALSIYHDLIIDRENLSLEELKKFFRTTKLMTLESEDIDAALALLTQTAEVLEKIIEQIPQNTETLEPPSLQSQTEATPVIGAQTVKDIAHEPTFGKPVVPEAIEEKPLLHRIRDFLAPHKTLPPTT